MRIPTALVATACCGIPIFVAGLAWADAAAQARFHDERARAAYERGRYELALQEFFLEQRAAPNPRVGFNIALCFEQLGRKEDAFLFFSEYLASGDGDSESTSYAERVLKTLESSVARVLVTSAPPGADIFVDQREHGSYGKTPRVVALSPGEHRVWVELAGHRSAQATITATKGEKVDVALSPARITGRLRVTSPAGPGTAFVAAPGGEAVGGGATPLELDLPPGPYEVTVRAPGHSPWIGLSAVDADKATEAVVALERLPPATGDITVTSNVPGALVELDGAPAGFSPTVLSAVAVGRHAVGLRAPGTVPWRGAIDVGSDRRAWVTVSLEPPPSTQRSPVTWVIGGLGGAALTASGVLAILAANAHAEFESRPPGADRSALRDRGVALNTASDVLLLGGVATLGAAVALYFLTAETRGRPSSAAVATSRR